MGAKNKDLGAVSQTDLTRVPEFWFRLLGRLTAVYVQAFDSAVRLYHVTVSAGLAIDQPLPAST